MSHCNRSYWNLDDDDDRWHDRRWHRHHRRHGMHFVPLLLFLGGVMVVRHFFIASIVFFAIAVAKTLGWMGQHGVAPDDRARAMDRGPRRANLSEKKELDLINAYAAALEKAGSDNGVAKELRERAEELVRTSGDATLALRELRAQLPPLKAASRDSFEARLRREVDFVNAAEGEMNGTTPPA